MKIPSFRSLVFLFALAGTSLFLIGYGPAAPRVTKLPSVVIDPAGKMLPNGEYVVSVWKDGGWMQAGFLPCDRFFRERTLDLSQFASPDRPARIRIAEKGGGAAHIDAVLLGGASPSAVTGSADARVLAKIAKQDFDVIDSFRKSIELTFAAGRTDNTLNLTARVEGLTISKTPFQFPPENLFKPMTRESRFYTYDMGSGTTAAPFFAEYSRTGSGHPSGITYGWVRNDRKNLYVKIDFTPDDTMDGAKDYATVYVNTEKGLKEFKVSAPERRWGRADFTYTDKVAYQHKVYDFTIPLKELGGGKSSKLQLAFTAYGTAAAGVGHEPSLVFNAANNTYLVVYSSLTSTVTGSAFVDGQLLTSSGSPAGPSFRIFDPQIAWSVMPSGAAFDNNHNRFLAVSHRQMSLSDFNIVGQLVNADTSLQGSLISLTTDTAWQVYPSAAYDLTNDRYLVAWQDDRNNAASGSEIYGALLSAATGSLVDTTGGTNFVIAGAPFAQTYPAVADDGTNHQFLVVWADSRAGSNDDIYGAFVSAADGSLVSTPSGTNFIVSGEPGYQSFPSVAFDSVNQRFLVVWADTRNAASTGTDIYGALVSAATGSLVSTASGTNFVISNALQAQTAPSVVYESGNGRFLVVWADQRNMVTTNYDIYGRYVNADGSLPGSDFILAGTGNQEMAPTAAYNAACGNTLVSYASYTFGPGFSIADLGLTLVGDPCAPGVIAGGGGGGGGCFIATAAYGSESAEDVQVLRRFRDRYLLTNAPGRAFVSWYYRVSPPMAASIAGSGPLKASVRAGIAPLVFAIRHPLSVLAILFALTLAAVHLKRRRHA